MAEEEPDKDEDRAAEDKQTIFNWVWPVGGKKNKGIGDTKADSVQITAGEDDFFGEREIVFGERILGAVVWMAKEFAINNKFYHWADDNIVSNNYEAGNKVDLERKE